MATDKPSNTEGAFMRRCFDGMLWFRCTPTSMFMPSVLRGWIAGEGKAGIAASLQPEDTRGRSTLAKLKRSRWPRVGYPRF